jgi:hypothetical protein
VPKSKSPQFNGSRPFKTDYAGAWCGYAKTRESAVRAAHDHIMRDGYSRCTIVDLRTDEEAAWCRLGDDKRSVITHTARVIRKVPR